MWAVLIWTQTPSSSECNTSNYMHAIVESLRRATSPIQIVCSAIVLGFTYRELKYCTVLISTRVVELSVYLCFFFPAMKISEPSRGRFCQRKPVKTSWMCWAICTSSWLTVSAELINGSIIGKTCLLLEFGFYRCQPSVCAIRDHICFYVSSYTLLWS